MLFNSLQFLVFFPLVTILYFVLPFRYRWMLLLAASCYFYMAFVPYYILILAFTIVVDYFAGILIEDTKDPKKKKWFLVASLVANIGVLAFFKYFNFMNENLSQLLNWLGVQNPVAFLDIVLPIGLSFHTFQAMSYTIEVYRGNFKAERHFGIYSLYVMFYPQLVAGPIERPQNVLPQFHQKHDFDYQRVVSGLLLMAWGMFKKVVVADRLAIMVNEVYNDPYNYEGIPLIIATVFFAFQIYCDFSGYTDIALGSAQVMGFKLMENFKRPYFSKNVSEFWTRWHISLSTWFRDYLYIPLGGNRVVKWRWYYNLVIVFLVSGLWHGANWTFIIWGALHGFYLVVGLITKDFREKVWNTLGLSSSGIKKLAAVATTFVLVTFAWIFFRSNNVKDGFYIAANLFDNVWNQLKNIFSGQPGAIERYVYIGQGMWEFILSIGAILVVETFHLFERKVKLRDVIITKPWWYRWPAYFVFVLAIILFGKFGIQEFIYFQF